MNRNIKLRDYYLTRDNAEVYVAEYGNEKGFPVIYIHGGPGGSCSEQSCNFFDNSFYHIYLLDQRGSGKSKEKYSRTNNNTSALIEDIKFLIETKISSQPCLLFGGSWGSTLSLLFAEKYPQYVAGLILRGIFLARKKDLDFYLSSNGAAMLRPLEYRKLLTCLDLEIGKNYQAEIISKKIIERIDKEPNLDSAEIIELAHAFAEFESSLCTIGEQNHHASDEDALSYTILENHYFINNCFIEENQILNEIDKLKNIDFIDIYHGSFDLVCSLEAAVSLKDRLPQANLHIIQTASHSPFEPSLFNSLKESCARFQKLHSNN